MAVYKPNRISKTNPRLRIVSANDTGIQNAFKTVTSRKIQAVIEGIRTPKSKLDHSYPRQPGSTGAADTSFGFDRKMQVQIEKGLNRRRKETISVVRSYYDGMFRTISDILGMQKSYGSLFAAVTYPRKFPAFNKLVFLEAGSRTPGRLEGDMRVPLEPGRSSPMRWRGLPATYVAKTVTRGGVEKFSKPRGRWKGLPLSRTAWRKTGTLASQFQAWYEANQGRFVADASYGFNRKPTVTPKPVNGVLWRYSYEIEYPATGNMVLNVILRNSFASGRAREFAVDNFAGKTIGKPAEHQSSWVRTVSRIQYAEYSRPIFARFAAAAGTQQRKALKAYLVNAERRKK